MQQISAERTADLLRSLQGAEIAVLGDVMLDRYFWGSVNRVSPEAPVPVVDVDDESFHLGGAANVAANIQSLGATPLLCGVVGDDTSGRILKSLATDAGLDDRGLIAAVGRPTTVKTRVIGNNQQIVRLDRETRAEVDGATVASVLEVLRARPNLRGIILEDYNKGFLSNALIRDVLAFARSVRLPVFVDPKLTNFFSYTGVTVFKPNRKEASEALGYSLRAEHNVREAGAELLRRLDCDNVLITLGAAGMMLFERNGNVSSVPTRAQNVADVSGAGDTAIATLASFVAAGGTVREAATLSNVAAGIVVGEPGIVAVSGQRLLHAVVEVERS